MLGCVGKVQADAVVLASCDMRQLVGMESQWCQNTIHAGLSWLSAGRKNIGERSDAQS
jgi:hypothetical protein